MNANEVIREAMKSCGWSQKTLAQKLGYVDENGEGMQSAVSNRVNGKRMSVATFVKFLDAMGYELAVKSSSPNSNKNEWKVNE